MKYIIYCRKSTDTEDKQVLSLDSQENELKELAQKFNLEVSEIYRESMSAKSEGRPIFAQVLNQIKTGKAEGIICWKLDRLARNFIDGGKIIDFLQRGIIKEIRTYEGTHLPNDNVLLMAVNFGMANQFIRDLSSNVKRGNRAKLEKGGWPNHAPFGYLNDKVNRSIIVDPVRSKYVMRAFDLYLQSKGFKEISDILYQEGLRTTGGKKVFRSVIQRIITNPFYTGIMVRDGRHYQGNHEPLISKSTFDKAQEAQENRSRPKSKRLFFPLRGFLKCETCGCSLTACLKKGHHYYYCTNGRQNCEEHKTYLRENYLYEKIADIFDNLTFSERKIELMYRASRERIDMDTKYFGEAIETLQNSLEGLKTREKRLLDTFLADQISKELYDEKVLEIQNERVSLNRQIEELQQREPSATLEPTKKVFLQASRAKKEFLEKDENEKKEILENLLWNLSLENGNVAQIKYKSPYDIIAKTPKNADFQTLCAGQDSNLRRPKSTRLQRVLVDHLSTDATELF